LLKNISPNKSLFRQSALNHSQNTTTQSALVIVKPAAWLFILCALCFLIALTSWGWFGKVELTTPALGIIVADKDFKEAEKLLNLPLYTNYLSGKNNCIRITISPSTNWNEPGRII
jgi:hypothetical protein